MLESLSKIEYLMENVKGGGSWLRKIEQIVYIHNLSFLLAAMKIVKDRASNNWDKQVSL